MLSKQAKEGKNKYMREYKRNMSPEAKEAQRAYLKNWKRNNPDKVKQYNINYWEKRAIQPTVENIQSEVFTLKKQGYSLREIGLRLGVSHMQVSRILNK